MTDPAPRSTTRVDRVGLLAALAMSVALVAITVRVAQLQLAPEKQLQEALRPHVTVKHELPVRGDILDRRGRLLAATKFGWKVVVDPTLLPEPPDEAIVKIAQALRCSPDEIGTRVMAAIELNRSRSAVVDDQRPSGEVPRQVAWLKELAEKLNPGEEQAGEGSEPLEEAAEGANKRPLRYVVLTKKPIDDETAERVRDLRVAKRASEPAGKAGSDAGVRISGVILERCAIREYPGGREVASLVGKVGTEDKWNTGIERRIDSRLDGAKGEVAFVREANGTPLWMEPGQVRPGTSGESVRLSIDLELQRVFIEELMRGIEEAEAAGGRIIGLDPATGEILAMADVVRPVADAVQYPWIRADVKRGGANERPASPITGGPRYITIQEDPKAAERPELARNRCIEDVYEPGSTFKPFVWSTITELGLARSDEVFETGHVGYVPFPGRPPISDVTKRDRMTWDEVLINSSNIGMIKAASRLTFAQLHDAVVRFKFGQPTGLMRFSAGQSLGGEASGLVTPMKAWSKYSQVSVAFGHEIAVTPVQMVRAFSVFARNGEWSGTMPTLRLTSFRQGIDDQGVIYRVLPTAIAEKTRRTMMGVAESMEHRLADTNQGTGETGWRYTMFGKSGTAEIPLGKAPKGFRKPFESSGYFDDQYNSSFIAGGPVESPRLVVLCVIDDPGPARTRVRKHYGALVAGPVVRRVMERSLTYLGVPPSDRPAIVAQHEAVSSEPEDASIAGR